MESEQPYRQPQPKANPAPQLPCRGGLFPFFQGREAPCLHLPAHHSGVAGSWLPGVDIRKKSCSRTLPSTSHREHALSHVQLLATPWTVAHQAPPSMGFPSQEYWSGLPLSSQGIFPSQGLNLHLLRLLHWWMDLLQLSYLGSPSTS